MQTSEKPLSWVVYRMTMRGKMTGMGAVCEQEEWEAMERAQPGYHILVRGGITNEAEAERMARGIVAQPALAKSAATPAGISQKSVRVAAREPGCR